MKWNHDCQECIYLGSDKNNDYYYHVDDTLIARYGNDGEYSSGFEFLFSSPSLNKALKLAINKNILSQEIILRIKRIQQRWFKYLEEDIDYKNRINKIWNNKKRFII